MQEKLRKKFADRMDEPGPCCGGPSSSKKSRTKEETQTEIPLEDVDELVNRIEGIKMKPKVEGKNCDDGKKLAKKQRQKEKKVSCHLCNLFGALLLAT